MELTPTVFTNELRERLRPEGCLLLSANPVRQGGNLRWHVVTGGSEKPMRRGSFPAASLGDVFTRESLGRLAETILEWWSAPQNANL